MSLISCPSGLSIDVRALKTREAKILSDRELGRSGGIVRELLAQCTTELIDPGIYAFENEKLNWSKVLLGDRLFALLEIRRLSWGDEYMIRVRCEEEGCKEQFEHPVDLGELMATRVRALSEASAATFKDGNRFETRVPSTVQYETKTVEVTDDATGELVKRTQRVAVAGTGTRVWFKLPLGEDEARAAALRQSVKVGKKSLGLKSGEGAFNALLEAAAMRVIEIEGIDMGRRRAYLDDLAMRDLRGLMSLFEEADCGVETGLSITCRACGWQQEMELPFEKSFFFPKLK